MGTGDFTNNGVLAFNPTSTDNYTVAGNISGTGSVNLLGSGTTTLSGSNSYAGGTTITAGALKVTSGIALGSGAITISSSYYSPASLMYSGTGVMTLSNDVILANGTMATIFNAAGASIALNWSALTLQGGSNGIVVSGRISGNSDIVVDGGTTTLSGSNTYQGATSIRNGATLVASVEGALPTANGRSDVSIDQVGGWASGNGNSTLALQANQAIASLSGETSSTVTLGGNTLTIGKAWGTTTFAGTIADGSSSGGSLVKDGASTQILTGNNSYAGTTTISGGTLQIGDGGTSGTLGSGAVVNNAALVMNRSDSVSIANAISGTGSFTQAGPGTTTLTASNSFTGTASASAGQLVVGNAYGLGSALLNYSDKVAFADGITNYTVGGLTGGNDFAMMNAGGSALALTVGNANQSATYSGSLSGTDASLTKIGTGTQTLTGNNTYTGTTTISGGALQVGNGGTTGTLGSGDVVNNSALVVNRSDAFTLANTISGTGSFTQAGAGTTTLSGANTYSGETTINAGALQMGNGGTTGSLGSGDIINNASLIVNRSDAITLGNTISGAGNLFQTGTGTTTLSGFNSYIGTTTISGGTLSLGTTGNLSGTTGVSVSTGSTLLLGSANQVNSAANLNLAGGTLSMGGNGLTRASEQTFNTLTLTANSVIDFANLTGNSSLTFASIAGLSASSLSIWNWSSAEGSATHLYDTQVGGLSAGNLANISFYSGSGTGLLGTGGFSGTEIVPVPEPSVVIAALLLLGSLAYGFCRRKKTA